MISRVLIQLLVGWRNAALDLGLLPPETRTRTREVFARLGAVATEDVLDLYGVVGGMQVPDDGEWRLWPLEEVAAQEPSPYGVLFSDWLLSCWSYRLLPVSPTRSAVYVDHHNGKPPTLLAESLEVFFERYLADPDSIIP